MKRSPSYCGVTGALLALACSHTSGAWAAGSIEASTLPTFLAAGNVAKDTIKCEPVDDDVLSSQTGKYAGSDMISGFVLSVLSKWDLPNGATAIAQGAIAVAQNTANQIIAQVETSARVTDAAHGIGTQNSGTPTPGTVASTNNSVTNTGNGARNSGINTDNGSANPAAQVTGGQKVAVNGVSQITQVAGNSNVGTNTATIDYSNAPAQLPGIPGATSQSTAFAANGNGSVQAGITFANNSINVSVQTPAGIATQSIVPGSAQQAGAIAQLLQIAGNNQQVANQLALTLHIQQMSAAMIRQTGVLQALRNTH
jgi:hypothetical protein